MGMGWSECGGPLRAWVTRVVEDVHKTLGDELVGAYLHGSLAQGSFYPPKSDVDLLFVVRGPLDDDLRRSFSEVCQALSALRPITGDLECTVIRTETARCAPHPAPFEAAYAGAANVERTGEDERLSPDLAAHLQSTVESGVSLLGPPVADVFGPVDVEGFHAAVDADIEWILEDEHLLETPFYGVLNLCRALWLWSGESPRLAPSKEEAGEWARARLPTPHAAVVSLALEAYRDDAPTSEDDRKTAGRSWDGDALRAFRDHVSVIRHERPRS